MSLTTATTESIQFDGRALSLGSGTFPAPPNQSDPIGASKHLSLSRSSPISLPHNQDSSNTAVGNSIINTNITTTINTTITTAITSSTNANCTDTLNKLSAAQISLPTGESSLRSKSPTTHQLSETVITRLQPQQKPTAVNYQSCNNNSLPDSLDVQNSQKSSIANKGLHYVEPLNMPPPQSGSPHAEIAPRKRRRKREDPQSCFANSEVSYMAF